METPPAGWIGASMQCHFIFTVCYGTDIFVRSRMKHILVNPRKALFQKFTMILHLPAIAILSTG